MQDKVARGENVETWRTRLAAVLIVIAGGAVCIVLGKVLFEGSGTRALTGVLVIMTALSLLGAVGNRLRRSKPELRKAYQSRFLQKHGSVQRLRFQSRLQGVLILVASVISYLITSRFNVLHSGRLTNVAVFIFFVGLATWIATWMTDRRFPRPK